MNYIAIILSISFISLILSSECNEKECVLDSVWCNRDSFDLNGDYRNCLINHVSNQEERQKCIAGVAFDNIVFPNSYFIITTDENEEKVEWFDDNITGRITPTGIFPDYRQNVDYLYGIASAESLVRGCEKPGVVPFKATKHYLTSTDNIVSVRYDYTMGDYPVNDDNVDDVNYVMNFTLSGFMKFNDDSTKIKTYDFTLQRWGLAVDEINRLRGGEKNKLDKQFICGVEATKCITKETQQYDHSGPLKRRMTLKFMQQFNESATIDDVPENIENADNIIEGKENCLKFLNTIEDGTWDHVIENTVTCRVLHSFLAIVHPDVHCIHLGPTGGMACTHYDYDFYYNQIY